MSVFTTTRPDGRSNADVLIDLVEKAAVDTVFGYEELANLLSHDNKTFDKHGVLSVVSSCGDRVVVTTQRALRNVRGVGYRVIPASEHRELANWHNDRANRQIVKGLKRLQHVKWDELTKEQRDLHEGTLLIVGGMLTQQRAQEERLRRLEQIVERNFCVND
jgi:NAD-dependent DNA ligase